MAILYLAYEGVLHPRDVLFREGCLPRLHRSGHSLFENNGFLEHVICARPQTCIVLHTWWVRYVGYRAAVQQLSPEVQMRVVGATLPGNRSLGHRLNPSIGPRRAWLQSDVARRQPESAVLLESDWLQVPAMLLGRALIVDGRSGLCSAQLCDALTDLLDVAGDEQKQCNPSSNEMAYRGARSELGYAHATEPISFDIYYGDFEDGRAL